MKKAVAVAMLLLFATVVAASSVIPRVTPKAQWQFACAYTHVFYGTSCDDLARPKVNYMNMPYLGFYVQGTNTIFINENLPREKQLLVMMHESVHYILDKVGPSMTKCESERAARGATFAAMGQPYNDGWRQRYGC